MTGQTASQRRDYRRDRADSRRTIRMLYGNYACRSELRGIVREEWRGVFSMNRDYRSAWEDEPSEPSDDLGGCCACHDAPVCPDDFDPAEYDPVVDFFPEG